MCLVTEKERALWFWYLSRRGRTVPLVLPIALQPLLLRVWYYIEPRMQFNRNNGRRCSAALD